jgi:hypothetical protein
MRGSTGAPEPARLHLAKILDSEFAQIQLYDVSACLLVQSIQNTRVGDSREATYNSASEKPNTFVAVRPPGDRRFRGARIYLGQFKSIRAREITGAQPNDQSTRCEFSALLHLADRVTRPFQC